MGRDPDDWFSELDDDDPAQRPAVAESDAPPTDDWTESGEAGEPPIAAEWSTTTKIAVVAVILVALLIVGLLVGGVFDSGSSPTTPPTTEQAPTTHPTTTQATTTQATTAAKNVPVPSSQLAFGDRGSDVSELQRALAAAGYSVGAVDGIYGPKTKAAVQELQADAKLTQDGIAGPKT